MEGPTIMLPQWYLTMSRQYKINAKLRQNEPVQNQIMQVSTKSMQISINLLIP